MKTFIALFALVAVAVANPLPLVQIIVNVDAPGSTVDPVAIQHPEIEPTPVIVVDGPETPEPIVPGPIIIPTPVFPGIIPEPIVLPTPVLPEIIPDPVVLPQPVLPEVIIPEPVVLPQPVLPEVIIPEPVVLPSPVLPEIVPEPVVLPAPIAPEVIVPEPVVLPSPEVNPSPVITLPEELN